MYRSSFSPPSHFLLLLTGPPGINKCYLARMCLNLTSAILSERHGIPNFNKLFVRSNFHPQNFTKCAANLLSLESLSRFCSMPLAMIFSFFFYPHILVHEVYFGSKHFKEIHGIESLFLDILPNLYLPTYFR